MSGFNKIKIIGLAGSNWLYFLDTRYFMELNNNAIPNNQKSGEVIFSDGHHPFLVYIGDLQYYAKEKMYSLMHHLKIPIPTTFTVRQRSDILTISNYFEDREFLFKPFDSANSEDIFKIDAKFLYNSYNYSISELEESLKGKSVGEYDESGIRSFSELKGVIQEILPIKEEYRVITFRSDARYMCGDIRHGYISQKLKGSDVTTSRTEYDGFEELTNKLPLYYRKQMLEIIDRINRYMYNNTMAASLSFDFYITDDGDLGLFEFQVGYGTDYSDTLYVNILKHYNLSMAYSLQDIVKKFNMDDEYDNLSNVIDDMMDYYKIGKPKHKFKIEEKK